MSQNQEQASKGHHRMMQQRQQAKLRAQEWEGKQRDKERGIKESTAQHAQVHQASQSLEQAAKARPPSAQAPTRQPGAQTNAHTQAAEQSGKQGSASAAEHRDKERQQEEHDKGQARQQFQRHLSEHQAREQSGKAGSGPWVNRAEEQRIKTTEVRAGQTAYRHAVEDRHRQNMSEVRAKRAAQKD